MNMKKLTVVLVAAGVVALVFALALSPSPTLATDQAKKLSKPQAETKAIDAEHLVKAQKLINDGVRYLLSQIEEDGGWSLGKGALKPAGTAIVLKALLLHPDFNADSPIVKKGFEVMLTYQQADGGIYDPKMGKQNYTTSIALMALAAEKNPKHKEAMDKAQKFLRGLQIQPGSESPAGIKITEDSPMVYGVSYGEHGRPDLSNLGMLMEALHEAGVSADDPAIQNALKFVLRCQNRSESNPLPFAQDGASDDGGAIYAPFRPDTKKAESKAGAGPGGKGLRSYGSMTYVMFKSMLYAGLKKDDPRVKAAYDWIRTYWTLDQNPNMPNAQSLQGLYYYYHMFAKALRAWGVDEIPSAKDKAVKHNWREELIDALAKRVSKDGSWTNSADRWNEGSGVLVTSFAVLALEESLKK